MAGGVGISHGENNGKEYPGNLTLYVTVTCIVAAMGGLIFGYDIGISGTCFVYVYSICYLRHVCISTFCVHIYI